MPKKIAEPKAKRPMSSRLAKNNFNIQGGIYAKWDLIMEDQANTFYQITQTLNITFPNQFVEEMQRLKAEIKHFISLTSVEPVATRRLTTVEGDIQDAIVEAEKDESVVERINRILDGAKETMEKLGESVAIAMNLGMTLGNLALLAWKVFGR